MGFRQYALAGTVGGKKRYAAAACFVLVLGMALAARAHAQPRAPEGQDSSAEKLDTLEARINMLQTQAEKSDREIQAKLAMVLQNQEKILRQLEIVKVRTTR